jgi:hypothetical protein
MLENTFYYDKNKNVYKTQEEITDFSQEYQFYYHDSFWNKLSWKIEPTESLENLYRERAQWIRDNYEYVILCYSGGNDSTNVLETFYYNNIHIDEILVVGALSQDPFSGSDANHNGDLYHNVFPTLNSLNLPNTKITIVDYTEYFNDVNQFSLVNTYGADYLDYIGTHKSLHNLFWSDLKKFIGKDNNKKTAWIMGIEKVELRYLSSIPYVVFNNLNHHNYGMSYINENFQRVNFYSDPTEISAKIQIKQAHVLNNLIKSSVPDYDLKFRKNPISSKLKNNLFYSYKIKMNFQSIKGSNRFVSARDTFILQKKNSEVHRLFGEALKKSMSSYSIPAISKPYFIE